MRLKQIDQMNSLYRYIGEDNINNCTEDLNDLVRCENLMDMAMPQSREDTLFNEFQKGNKIVLGCF